MKIRFILVARDQCELLEPGYQVRNRDAYETWRKSRIEAVRKVETDPEFRSQRTELLNSVRKQLAAGAKTAEEQEDVDEFRITCDSRLPEVMAKADDPPPTPQNVQSAPAVVVRHSVQHKSATQMGGSTPATPPSQP